MKKQNFLAFIALALPILFWGSAFPSIRYALSGYTPMEIATLRFIIASLLLVIYSKIKKFGLPEIRDLPMILFFSLTGVVLYHLPLNTGAKTVTAGTISLLNATAPVFTAILSFFIVREKMRGKGWVGISISFLGAGILASNIGGGISFSFGALWILFAAFSESFYFIYQKKLLSKYGALPLTTYVIWFGALMMLPFSGNLFESVISASISSSCAVLYLGIFPTAIAYVLWAYDLCKFPASRVASLLYLSPVIAISLGWFWLGENPSVLSLVGGALAIGGVACVQRAKYE